MVPSVIIDFWFLWNSTIRSHLIQIQIAKVASYKGKYNSQFRPREFIWQPKLAPSLIFVVYEIREALPEQGDHLLLDSSQCITQIGDWGDDASMFGFHDHEKVDGILNVMLSLVMTTTITNQVVSCLLIPYKSEFNLMYLDISLKLVLQTKIWSHAKIEILWCSTITPLIHAEA